MLLLLLLLFCKGGWFLTLNLLGMRHILNEMLVPTPEGKKNGPSGGFLSHGGLPVGRVVFVVFFISWWRHHDFD